MNSTTKSEKKVVYYCTTAKENLPETIEQGGRKLTETKGAFHHKRSTSQRRVGIHKRNETMYIF